MFVSRFICTSANKNSHRRRNYRGNEREVWFQFVQTWYGCATHHSIQYISLKILPFHCRPTRNYKKNCGSTVYASYTANWWRQIAVLPGSRIVCRARIVSTGGLTVAFSHVRSAEKTSKLSRGCQFWKQPDGTVLPF